MKPLHILYFSLGATLLLKLRADINRLATDFMTTCIEEHMGFCHCPCKWLGHLKGKCYLSFGTPAPLRFLSKSKLSELGWS